MKKASLTLALLAAMFTLCQAQIIISEIMYNPPEGGTDSLEYFEIHNNSNSSVDISGWSFTKGVEHVFPSGTALPAGGYLTLAKNANAFQLVFGFQPVVWTNGALSNNGEPIELSDASGTVIDAVTYGNAAPWPIEANGGGSSLVLCDFNSDNSLPNNWIGATTGTGVTVNNKEVFGNPNAASGCQGSGNIQAGDDSFVAPTGLTTTFNVLNNDLFLGNNPVVVLAGAPTQGSATVVGNTIEYTPNPGYCGPDMLTYTVSNSSSSDNAVVTIDVRCYPVRTIPSVTTEDPDGVAMSVDLTCELQGVVYGVNLRPVTNNHPSLLFTLVDPQGNGISVSSLVSDLGYTVKEKDQVTVRGIIGQFNGMTEIRPDIIVKNSSNNALVAPQTVITHTEDTESKLIKINNLRFANPADWAAGQALGGSGFTIKAVSNDHPLDTVSIRIDRDIETYNVAVPAEPFDLTGLGGQFDSSSPFTEGYQVLPRYNNDFSTLKVGVKEADFSADVVISPNPARETLVIEMKNPFDRITLLHASGRKIKSYESPEERQKVDLSLLPAGAYFVRFERNGAAWTTRFVKI